jgi:hypothetical protein
LWRETGAVSRAAEWDTGYKENERSVLNQELLMDLDNEKIAARAYQLYQERFGGQAPLDDWLRAEWEVKNGLAEVMKEKTPFKPDQGRC